MVLFLAVVLPVISAALPATASAHGPVAPVATNYLARITGTPAGVSGKIVDGYVRMWLHVAPAKTVVVFDYRGAPYLRFSHRGVQVNRNSEMFYLNLVPGPGQPPADLTSRTRPAWSWVSGGHSYEWHDGRLQALASIALAPGTRYVGRWRIPLRVNGHIAAITGGLWHTPRPSPVWFWPIAVIVLCVLAGWRVHDDRLDRVLARTLGLLAGSGSVAAVLGVKLHGRPGVPVLNFVVLALVLLFAAWALWRLVQRRPLGWFGYLAVAGVSLWEGLEVVPTLYNHYVLIELPGDLARVTAVVTLGAGIGLLPYVFRWALRNEPGEEPAEDPASEEIVEPRLPA